MKAIILAAGVGQRLGSCAGRRPKCLLEFTGSSLLARHVRVLEALGIPELLVVTGHEREAVEKELERVPAALQITTVHNPDYRAGSLISLCAAGTRTHPGEAILLMDADVLYHREILRRLLNSPHENCFLLDRDFIPGEEPVKLCVADGSLVEFRKQVAPDLRFDFQGESVGFFKFSPDIFADLLRRGRKYIDAGQVNAPYEEVIRDCLLEFPGRFYYEDITGLPWTEIDFPEDLRRAEREILPCI